MYENWLQSNGNVSPATGAPVLFQDIHTVRYNKPTWVYATSLDD